ncbi:MAG: hypothetical protein ACRC36_03635 [Lacrimispora sphenoides]
MNLSYGQVLGTNSKKGHTTILEKAVDLTTGFKPGKIGYGLDFFLGATLNAKIGSDQVAIECNVRRFLRKCPLKLRVILEIRVYPKAMTLHS